jgi:hypothetical protein
MAVGRKPATPLAERSAVATVSPRICAIDPANAPRMRASHSLLSASALLLGALAVGNPFLSRGSAVEAAGSKQATNAGLVRRDLGHPTFAPLWARQLRQQSPKDLLERLPRLVAPTVTPASWQPAVPERAEAGAASGAGIDFQRPQ